MKRRLTAVFLLVLMLALHMGQVLHSHDGETSQVSNTSAKQFSKSNDCAVCDYDFAKDATYPATVSESINESFYTSNYTFYQSRRATSTGLCYADRGPPVLG